jgi:tryptophan synthase alpha chain
VNRLDAIFVRGKKVLIAYLCVGDPSIEESIVLARACIRAGADVIELGVPFSDPTADGPVIASASQRAIRVGGGLEATFRASHAIRSTDPQVGLVLFGYYNPLFVRGETRSARDAAEAGIDALLVVDLPIEASDTLHDAAKANGLGLVPLLAPTSRAERITAAAHAAARGPVPFIYYISVTGVTGSGAIDAHEAGARAQQIARQTGRPVVVGFGIDSGAKARRAAEHADGVVVGTALVRAIERGRTPDERRDSVERLVGELRLGLDHAPA